MRAFAFVSLLTCVPAASAAGVDYLKDVKPILAGRCYACHGALKQKADLRLDTAKSIREGGSSGPAVTPKKSGESLLLKHVRKEDGFALMPPASEGEHLSTAEIETLAKWIDAGAVAPAGEEPDPDPRDHWAFRAPKRPPVPPGAAHPIDAFLAAKWKQHGLTPQPPADKRLLLRRVYLDLAGLPPTAAEIESFLRDPSPTAYETRVDALLASPRYGERWGRHFLDIWRYSDWWGLGQELRNSQKHLWHWRDYVIDSLNADVGYDEMIRDMLAADERHPTDPKKLRATGFLARQYFLFNRNTWLDETVEHTGKAFLGLTFNCAKCHDHKFDPIAQLDYYRLRAFFEPYQVRTDFVPGNLDPAKAGIPRAFDSNLDAKTFKFVRGDEKRPDTNRPLSPGLPALLAFDELKIQPVKLPAVAVQPGLRPEILDALRRQLDARLTAVRADVVAAKQRLAAAPTDAKPAPAPGKVLVSDTFAEADPKRWTPGAGVWKYADGKLIQRKADTGASELNGHFDHPADFAATLTFTITGGNPYRSVGLTFDVGGGNEVLAYVSAGGNKVQVAHKKAGGEYVYPADSLKAATIPLNKPLTLGVAVRGKLVNVSLNGALVLAYRLPVERKAGRLVVITHSATAAFTGFELRELPPAAVLTEPGGAVSTPKSRADMEAGRDAAEMTLAVATAERDAFDHRVAAMRTPGDKALAAAAAKAEKTVALRAAELDLRLRERDLAAAPAGKKAEATMMRDAARKALDGAKKALEKPGETFTPLAGAVKAAESNAESAASRARPFPATSSGRRTALADWIADARNPLTARVLVNHVWMRHFAAPLVPTVFDFGRKGTAPTHPELLDWLGVEFAEKKWSLKHLHRLIVTSAVYRMSSSALNADANTKADPDNKFLWRQNPTRLEAQAIRDSLLHLGGRLDLALGGPSVPLGEQAGSTRRSLYFFQSHNDHNKFLSQFDDANVLDCYRRTQSVVPAQALTLSNSKLAVDAAGAVTTALEQRLGKVDDGAFVGAAFELLLGTAPTAEERATCLEAMKEWREVLKTQKHPDPPGKARRNLIGALLNHNDFVTVR